MPKVPRVALHGHQRTTSRQQTGLAFAHAHHPAGGAPEPARPMANSVALVGDHRVIGGRRSGGQEAHRIPCSDRYAGARGRCCRLRAGPRDLFVDEATAILAQFIGPQVIDACTVLLQEAFCGRGPLLDFNAAARGTFVSADSQRAFVQSLIDQAEKIPVQENRPIWPDRHHVAGPAELLDRQRQLPRAFTNTNLDPRDSLHGC
jgi:hypothetical protein